MRSRSVSRHNVIFKASREFGKQLDARITVFFNEPYHKQLMSFAEYLSELMYAGV